MIRTGFILCTLMILSGCMGIGTVRAPGDDQIQQWVEQEYYGNALDALRLRQQRTSSEALSDHIEQIQQQADTYDQAQAQAVDQAINARDLAVARDILVNALEHYPEGEQLQRARERLRRVQRTQVNRLQAQQLLAKSEWLLKAKSIQNSLLDIKDNANGQSEDLIVDSYEIQNTAAELYHLGLKALQKGDLELADSCLTVSNKLHPHEFTSAAIARLNILKAEQEARREKQRQAEQRRQRVVEIREIQAIEKNRRAELAVKQRQFDSLYFLTTDMLKDNQLSSAKTNLDKMRQLLPNHPKLAALNTEFRAKLPDHITALVERGKQLYIEGKIDKARKIWHKALLLDPDNREIQENIERADRVLGRLKQLQQH